MFELEGEIEVSFALCVHNLPDGGTQLNRISSAAVEAEENKQLFCA